MTSPLVQGIALRLITPVIEDHLDQFQQALASGADWEEVSLLASKNNAQLLRSLGVLDKVAENVAVEDAADMQRFGLECFRVAVGVKGGEYDQELLDGIDQLVRWRLRRSSGEPDKGWMDVDNRRGMFLVETAGNVPLQSSEEEEYKE